MLCGSGTTTEARRRNVDVAIERPGRLRDVDVHPRRAMTFELRREQRAEHGHRRSGRAVAAVTSRSAASFPKSASPLAGDLPSAACAAAPRRRARGATRSSSRADVRGLPLDLAARVELHELAQPIGEVRRDGGAMRAIGERHERARERSRDRLSFDERARRVRDVRAPARRHGGARRGLDVEHLSSSACDVLAANDARTRSIPAGRAPGRPCPRPPFERAVVLAAFSAMSAAAS